MVQEFTYILTSVARDSHHIWMSGAMSIVDPLNGTATKSGRDVCWGGTQQGGLRLVVPGEFLPLCPIVRGLL